MTSCSLDILLQETADFTYHTKTADNIRLLRCGSAATPVRLLLCSMKMQALQKGFASLIQLFCHIKKMLADA